MTTKIEGKRATENLLKLLSNHVAECGQCGRQYNNTNEMYSSKFGCPRNCKK